MADGGGQALGQKVLNPHATLPLRTSVVPLLSADPPVSDGLSKKSFML
jgi:hypothetical protein